MENKMKKLIALFATTAVASSAMGAIALSGTASVAYDDNGSAAEQLALLLLHMTRI